MKEPIGNWLQTYTGKRVYPLSLTSDQIDIIDIAHSLSLTCRFNGHVREFYSVAQHCYLMSQIVPKEYAFAALMHDACETYTSDIPHPIKSQVHVAVIDTKTELGILLWDEWETGILKIIFNKYGIPIDYLDKIKEPDRRLCVTEEVALFDSVTDEELIMWPPYKNVDIVSCPARSAEIMFLDRFKELNKQNATIQFEVQAK